MASALEDYERTEFEALVYLANGIISTFYKAVRAKDHAYRFRSIIRYPDGVHDAWYNHYENLLAPLKMPHFDERSDRILVFVRGMLITSLVNDDHVCDNPLSLEELKTVINEMLKAKAGGHKYVVIKHIKLAGDTLLIILVKLSNKILETEIYPDHFNYTVVLFLKAEERKI